MKKPILKTYLALALALVMGLLGGNLRAQSTMAYATYGADSPATGTQDTLSGTATLDAFTVTGFYGNDILVEDTNTGTTGVGGELYSTTFTPASTAIGDTYSAGLAVSVSTYFGDPEFTITGTPTLTGTAPVSFTSVSTASLAQTTAADTTGGTSGKYTYTLGYTTYAAYDPVTFTLTPTASITTSAIGTTLVTDSTTNTLIDFYKFATATALTAGTTYTITGMTEQYNATTLEILSGAVVTAIPEPNTWMLMGLGLLLIGGIAYRRRFAV